MSEGFAQLPYVAARVEFEPATLRMEGTKLSHHAPQKTSYLIYSIRWQMR